MKLPWVICAKYSDLYDNICIEIIRNPAFGLDFLFYICSKIIKFLFHMYLNGKENFYIIHV